MLNLEHIEHRAQSPAPARVARAWVAVGGYLAIVLLGFAGVLARMKNIAWLPGGIDVRLSGRQDDWQLGAGIALAWLVIFSLLGVVFACRLARLRSSDEPSAA